MQQLRTFALVVSAVAVLAACGPSGSTVSPSSAAPSSPTGSLSTDPSVFPQIVSSELVTGRAQRVLFSFVDANVQPVAGPERTASVGFTGPGGETIPASDGTFIWAIEDVAGLYLTHATFPVAGDWTATFTTQLNDAAPETIPFEFEVKADSSVLQVGEAAPSVETPTIASAGSVAAVATDAAPVERFYETSIADALAAREPFVVAFATPKFCQTATCGPTLERVKAIAAGYPEVTFINVEPYELEDVDGQLQPTGGKLTPVEASNAFGLISEPFLFVIGSDGTIAASFELIFTDAEVQAAIDGVVGEA